MSRRIEAAALARVLTPELLRAQGYSADLAEKAAADGDWQRGAGGIYLPHSRPATDMDLVAVAREHLGPQHLVTGLVVLRALNLRWLPADPQLHALVPANVERAGGRLIRVTRTSCYDGIETWVRYGSKFVTAERAVVDAARAQSNLRDVRGVVLGAVADRWATPDELLEILARGQRNGSALTRRAIRDAERGCASPPEAELVDALVGKGVPFYVNAKIYLGDVLLGSPDVWLVGRGVGGEVESVEWHGDDDQTESTYDRHERMTAPGLELVHLSVRRVRKDVEEAATHLLSTTPVVEPPGLRVVPRGPLLR